MKIQTIVSYCASYINSTIVNSVISCVCVCVKEKAIPDFLIICARKVGYFRFHVVFLCIKKAVISSCIEDKISLSCDINDENSPWV